MGRGKMRGGGGRGHLQPHRPHTQAHPPLLWLPYYSHCFIPIKIIATARFSHKPFNQRLFPVMQPVNGSIVRGPRRRSRDRLETQNAREDSDKWGADSRSEGKRGEGLHLLRALRDAAVRANVDFGRLLPQHLSSREHPSIGPLRHRSGQTTPLPSAPSCIGFIYGVTRWEDSLFIYPFLLLLTASTYLLLEGNGTLAASWDYFH